MMRPSEIRVWSLIWPNRASLGNVRTVSTASARADLLAATTASAADLARVNAISPAAVATSRPTGLVTAEKSPPGRFPFVTPVPPIAEVIMAQGTNIIGG